MRVELSLLSGIYIYIYVALAGWKNHRPTHILMKVGLQEDKMLQQT